MIKKTTKLFVTLMLFACITHAQTTIENHQFPQTYALSSPEAAGLTKVGDIPVDLNSGKPQISIPLYTITSGNISIPISLSYDASGILVEQQAGSVGLGWTLSAGGAITRSVRDKDDDAPTQKYEQVGGATWTSAVPSTAAMNAADFRIAYGVANDRSIDAIPDLYNYSHPNGSGQFVYIGPSHGIKLLPKKNVLIKQAGTNEWQIIDEMGYTFNYGGTASGISLVETNNIRTISTGSGAVTDINLPVKTGWMLRQIISPNKADVVNFTYGETYYEFISGRTQTHIYEKNVFDYYTTLNQTAAGSSENYQKISGRVLKNIEFAGGSVGFMVSGNNRLDLTPNSSSARAPRVESMTVSDNQGNVVRQVNFYYSYFPIQQATTPNPNSLRLRLDSIVIWNGSAQKERYSFKYSNLILPPKNSFAIDHWGYYNGKDENATLVPTYSSLTDQLDYSVTPAFILCPNNYSVFKGADREVDTSFTQAGMLTEIKYPTGGSIKFNYEANDVPRVSIRYKGTIIDQGIFINKTSNTQYQDPDGPQTIPPGNNNSEVSYTYEFEVPQNSHTVNGISAKLTSFATFPSGASNAQIVQSLTRARLSKVASGGLQLVRVQSYGSQSITSQCHDDIKLYPGTYVLTVFTASPGYSISANLKSVIPTEIDPSSPNIKVGGLRIKSIVTTDPYGSGTTNNFYYKDPDNPAISSGYSKSPLAPLRYLKRAYAYHTSMSKAPECWYYGLSSEGGIPKYIGCCTRRYEQLVISSSSDVELGGGPSVYYKYVTSQKANGEAGKVVNEFAEDHTLYTNWRNGNLLAQMAYDASGNLVTKTEFEYETAAGAEEFTGYDIACLGLHPCQEVATGNNTPMAEWAMYEWKTVRMLSEWNRLTKKSTTTYSQQATPLTQVEEYQYNPLNMAVSSIVTNMSDGRKSIQRMRYPVDYPVPNNVTATDEAIGVQSLNQQHIHNQVVEKYTSILENSTTEHFTGGSYLAFNPVQSSQYAVPGTNPAVYRYAAAVANSLYVSELQSPQSNWQASAVSSSTSTISISKDPSYRLRYSVLHYDNRLNPVEVADSRGFRVINFWMYDQTLLTATVKNANLTNVAYTSFEDAQNKGQWDYQLSAFSPEIINDPDAPTGHAAYMLSSTTPVGVTKNNLDLDVTYVLSFWSKGSIVPSVSNYLSHKVGNTCRGYTYHEYVISGVTSVSITSASTINVDEVRLYPESASMTTYAHDPLVGIISGCDANNNLLRYEYDGLGRLDLIRDQNGSIVKKLEYGIQSQD